MMAMHTMMFDWFVAFEFFNVLEESISVQLQSLNPNLPITKQAEKSVKLMTDAHYNFESPTQPRRNIRQNVMSFNCV